MNVALRVIKHFLVYLAITIAALLMLSMIAEYASFETDIHFLASKQGYISNNIWRYSFYIHVFTAVMPLMAGLTQFSPQILSTNKKLHRIIGKIYVLTILFINVPTGFILAIYANGHLPGKLAFLTLDILWFYFTLKAWLEIRKGNIMAHRKFMYRSYALTFSAITLRTWKLVLPILLSIDSITLYQVDAWLGFIPNLLVAEWFIRKTYRSKENKYITSK